MPEPNPSIRLIIIQQEIQLHENTLYLCKLRYRVNTEIGSDKSVLDALMAEMMKIEHALDILHDVVRDIEKEIETNKKAVLKE